MRLFSDINEISEGPVFQAAPSARGLSDWIALHLPENALLWAPGAGLLAVLALYVLLETGLFSREDAR
ncbi:MAG: hypothetical protein ACQEUZ_05545 [Pseudomonadota bacterium]